MNFFREMQNSVNSAYKGVMPGSNNTNNNRNNDHIVQLIRSCTYSDDTKFMIEKSVRQVLHVYPQYIVDKIEFAEKNVQRRFIELKGEISVEYKGNLSMFIMYPNTFPQAPPFLRIINPNPQQFSVHQNYKKYQSKTDARSYLLNQCLQEVKSWKPNSSVASIIIEVNDLVRNNYPFNPNNQWVPSNGSGGNNNYYPPNQGKTNGWNQQPAKQPPIPFKVNGSSGEMVTKSQKLVMAQKQKLTQMEKKHVPLLGTLQTLDANKRSLQSESSTLSRQSEKMINFMNNSDQHEIRNFANLVSPADEISEMVLEKMSSIKAREETIHLLESKFNEQEISFEDFMKNVRKFEEGKFMDRFMLTEYMQNYTKYQSSIILE